MKKIFLILLITVLLLITSCDKTIDNENIVDSTETSEISNPTTPAQSPSNNGNNNDNTENSDSKSTKENEDVYNDGKEWIPF